MQRSNLYLILNAKLFIQILTRLLIVRIGLTSTCPFEVNQRFESAVHYYMYIGWLIRIMFWNRSRIQILWEGHKILKNLPLFYNFVYYVKTKFEIFSNFCGPSQNIWTLQMQRSLVCMFLNIFLLSDWQWLSSLVSRMTILN